MSKLKISSKSLRSSRDTSGFAATSSQASYSPSGVGGQAGGTKPGTLCGPSTLPEIQQVITINVKDLSGLVQREVDAYIASLPFANCDFITVQKAAELLKVYEDTVRVYIRNGQLSAIRLGKDYRIRIVDF